MTWVHLTPVSSNRKTGAIPVSTTESKSCPKECGISDECYAGLGHLGMWWKKVNNHQYGDNWDAFCKRVRKFRRNTLWRHNQAGDLPKDENQSADVDKLDSDKCLALAKASSHTDGWTYTHYDPTDEHNNSVIDGMNKIGGLVVNLSADTMEQADEYHALGIAPITVVLPEDAPNKGNKTPNGLPILVCPAQVADEIACDTCKVCQKRDRKCIVGFKAHGSRRKKLSEKLVSNAV